MSRRRVLLLSGGAMAALLGSPAAGQAQPPPDAAQFLAFAHSSALLQERAARLAAERETRPEVKAFAGEMAQFRTGQLERLRAAAEQRGLTPPQEMGFGHGTVFENLSPLDYLALSRRYAEVQVQALEQEIGGYEAAAQGSDEGLQALAAEMLPQLRQHLEGARRMLDAVSP